MGAERTVETTQLALRFGGSRERLIAIKNGESLLLAFLGIVFAHIEFK